MSLAERRERWERLSLPFREVAERHREAIDSLRVVSFAMFRQMATEPSYTRRQPFALRVPARPDLATVVRPSWSHVDTQVKLNSDQRVIIDPTLTVDRGGKPKQVIIAEMQAGRDGGEIDILVTYLHFSRLAEFTASIEAIEPFLEDPLGHFRRSDAPNCGICGRKLSDPRSREQGIGPECIERVDLIAAMAAASRT